MADLVATNPDGITGAFLDQTLYVQAPSPVTSLAFDFDFKGVELHAFQWYLLTRNYVSPSATFWEWAVAPPYDTSGWGNACLLGEGTAPQVYPGGFNPFLVGTLTDGPAANLVATDGAWHHIQLTADWVSHSTHTDGVNVFDDDYWDYTLSFDGDLAFTFTGAPSSTPQGIPGYIRADGIQAVYLYNQASAQRYNNLSLDMGGTVYAADFEDNTFGDWTNGGGQWVIEEGGGSAIHVYAHLP